MGLGLGLGMGLGLGLGLGIGLGLGLGIELGLGARPVGQQPWPALPACWTASVAVQACRPQG